MHNNHSNDGKDITTEVWYIRCESIQDHSVAQISTTTCLTQLEQNNNIMNKSQYTPKVIAILWFELITNAILRRCQ